MTLVCTNMYKSLELTLILPHTTQGSHWRVCTCAQLPSCSFAAWSKAFCSQECGFLVVLSSLGTSQAVKVFKLQVESVIWGKCLLWTNIRIRVNSPLTSCIQVPTPRKCPSLLVPISNFPTSGSYWKAAKLCCQTHLGKRRHCSPGPWWHLLSMGCLHTRPLSGCPLSGPAFRLHTSQSRLTMCSTRPTHRVVEAETGS